MTLVIGKGAPSPGDLAAWLNRPDTFLHCATSVDGRPVRLARYQVAHLRDGSKFRIRQKARGVGFSWISAAEALAKAHLRDDYTGLFVSMNLEEAIEKVRYANALYETIPLKWRKRKAIDNRTSLEFEDSSGRHRSRLISHPCKDPRGKHKADVFLDEFAHYGRKQRSIYVASVPIVSRGVGQLTIGSTPLAAGDLFHEIVTQERKKYPMFSRQSIPWWACPDLCRDVVAAEAEAPEMETAE
ncbi:MAG: terminase large subunit domain-containing protein, partial [Planctomycetota bacterium]